VASRAVDAIFVEASELIVRLYHLTAPELAALADALRHGHDTADGEVAWWRTTISVTAALRHQHRSREAGLFAHRASAAVVEAATRAGVADVARDDVTLVARAAAEVARALVAADGTDASRLTLGPVLAPWQPVLAVAA